MSKKAILVICLIIVGFLTALIIPYWTELYPDTYDTKYRESGTNYSYQLYNSGECRIDISNTTTVKKDFLKNLRDYKEEIKSIRLYGSYTYLDQELFKDYSKLESIDINSNTTLKTIDKSAFEGCSSLKSISLPSSVTAIKDGAFKGCTSLKSIVIPSGVRYINDSVFENCISLERVTFSSSITQIGNSAFYHCTALKKISPLYGVEKIGEQAFGLCSSLESVLVYDNIKSVEKNAFDNCPAMTYFEDDNSYFLGNADNPYAVFIKPKKNRTCHIYLSTKVILVNAFDDYTGSYIEYDGTKEEFALIKPYISGQHRSNTVRCSNGTLTF